MSSVDAISSLIIGKTSSYSKKSGLSQETIRKLSALGIDISSVSSESDAKKIIEEEEAKKSSDTDNESENKQNTSDEEALLNDIKNLARKLGISINQNDKIDNIFDEISSNIDEMKNNSYNSNLNVFISEFDLLKTQFKNMYSGDSSLLSAMDMLSKTNRASFNL